MIEALKNFVSFARNGQEGLSISIDQFLDQIDELERIYKQEFINKSNRFNITLTDFGRKIVPYANKIITAFHESASITTMKNCYDDYNQLTIGLVQDSASTWALNCLKNFNKMHPGLRLVLLADNQLTNEMSDSAHIIFWAIERIPAGFDAFWYIEFKYGLYASCEYLQRNGIPTIENIDKHSIIAYSGKDNNAHISNWHLYGGYGLPPLQPTVLSQSRDLIVKMAADGMGIGAISDRQDVYYRYSHLNRVLKDVFGPVLKSYFLVRKGLNEQIRCNIQLLDRLFRRFFFSKGINVFDIFRKSA
jgi:DNA-binding transcriptional LysR family regulator